MPCRDQTRRRSESPLPGRTHRLVSTRDWHAHLTSHNSKNTIQRTQFKAHSKAQFKTKGIFQMQKTKGTSQMQKSRNPTTAATFSNGCT